MPEILRKKTVAISIEAPFIFLQKNVMSGCFPSNFQWVGQAVNKCNQNRENKCIDKTKLINTFTDPLQTIYSHSEPKTHRDCCDFFYICSLYLIINKLLPEL